MSNQEETVEITEAEYKSYKDDIALKDALLALRKNKHFKTFIKAYVDESLKNLGLNLGVQPQMRPELVLQIEARRVFNQFINTAVDQGFNAEEILKGVEDVK